MNPLQNLFKVGITRDEFVRRFKELQNSCTSNLSLIFNINTGISAEDVFDTINIHAKEENTLEEADIQNLAQKYQNDGENTISESDITILYNEIYGNNTPQNINQVMLDNIKTENMYGYPEGSDAGVDNAILLHSRYMQFQIESVDILIENQKQKTKEKIELIEQRIDDTILANDKIKLASKEKYQNLLEQKQEIEENIKTKQKEIKDEQEKETPDSDKIDKLNSEISSLNIDLSTVSDKITTERKNLSEKGSKSFKSKIKSYESQIKQEEENCKNQIQLYNTLKENIIQTLNAAIEISLNETTETSGEEYDENIIVTHDAVELTAAWNTKPGVELTETFVQKTMQVAENIGCDANDLLALMYSESGFRHDVQNKIGATGLIQFMPQTAKSLGTTTDALKNMSPEQQLDYVEKYFLKNKAAAGMSGERMSAGDLYAITFLPARAKNNELTTKDEKYYKFNYGLDTNKDGVITKKDLSQRLHKYIPAEAEKRKPIT